MFLSLLHTNSAYSNTKEARKKEIIAVVNRKLPTCSQFVHIYVLELCHFYLKGKGKMRRYISLLLALVMVFALAACADTPAENTETPADEAPAADENTETPSVDANDGADEEALPDFTELSEGLDENGGFAGIKASDLVTLPEYKGVAAPETLRTADPEEVERQIYYFLENSGATKIHVTDRAVQDGDTLNIDYVGSVDGVEFQGGNTQGQGAEVTIGVTNYIDDFLQQLIGHRPGENFDIEVTFPEDYGRDDLNGKDAIFNITINYIVEENPDAALTDEIAAQYGFADAAALTAEVEEFVLSNARSEFVSGIYDAAVVNEMPESVSKLIEKYITFNIERNYGVDLETYASYYGTTAEEYLAHGVESVGKDFLAALAIAETEGLTVTEEDIENAGLESAVEVFGLPYVKRYLLLQDKVPNLIIDNAVIG